MRVLDVGCGSATITAEVARRLPGNEIVALTPAKPDSSSPAEPLRARERLHRRRRGSRLLPAASFDLVYSRFLLEYLPAKRRVVREFARVLPPGRHRAPARHRREFVNSYPPDPQLQPALGQALALLAATGFDPHVGRRLRSLLQQAGKLPRAGLKVEP